MAYNIAPQSQGEKKEMSNSPQQNVQPSSSGGTVQTIGETVKMNESPVGMNVNGSSAGKVQTVGEQVNLSRTPHKGHDSYPTPMSKRTSEFLKGQPG